jgi:C1A family cysteine protease
VILRVPFNVESIKTCLHNQIPVIVDIKLVDNVGRQIRENGGFLTIPDLDNTFINRINPHSVLIVGYNEQTQHFIVRNSWGKDWV